MSSYTPAPWKRPKAPERDWAFVDRIGRQVAWGARICALASFLLLLYIVYLVVNR